MNNKLIKIDKSDLIRYSNSLVKRSSQLITKLQPVSVVKYKPRILSAINDDNFISVFEEEMTTAGFSIKICRSFEKIINISRSENYDLAILTNLGLLPGYIPEVIKNLKLINDKMPILVLSAYGKVRYDDKYIDDNEVNFVKEISNLGAESFYPLPYDYDDLLNKINEIIYFNFYGYNKNNTNQVI